MNESVFPIPELNHLLLLTSFAKGGLQSQVFIVPCETQTSKTQPGRRPMCCLSPPRFPESWRARAVLCGWILVLLAASEARKEATQAWEDFEIMVVGSQEAAPPGEGWHHALRVSGGTD